MGYMRTSNPTLNDSVFRDAGRSLDATQRMTLAGTANRSFFFLSVTILLALWSYDGLSQGTLPVPPGQLLLLSLVGSLIAALVTMFKKPWAAFSGTLYCLFQGILMGAISAAADARYPGVAFEAILVTFGTFLSLLIVYRLKLISATENFKLGVLAATGGIALVYLASFVLGFFGIHIPQIHEAGPIGIAFSVFVVIIAALNLVLDFDFIERGVEQGAPKYMEWYAAFGLMVTLIWLYIEVLKLLSKLRSRR